MLHFVYNGESSEDYGLVIERSYTHPLPGVIDRDIMMPGRRGRYSVDAALDQGVISFQCRFVEASFEDVHEKAEKIAAWLNPEHGVQDMTFSGRPGRLYRARVSDMTSLDQMLIRGRVTVTFKIPDGVVYGGQRFWETGMIPPHNDGGVEAPLEITATIKEATPDLELTLGTETILIHGPFVDTNEIIITENDHVTVNGASAMDQVDISSDFFRAPVGDFEVTADPVSTELEIKWTERWL